MKTLIIVPSYNRPYVFNNQIGRWLYKVKAYDWIVICEPSQELYYEQVVPKENLITSSDGCGLTGQLMRGRKYAEDNGYELIMKLDDEFKFTTDNYKSKDSDKALVEMLDDIVPDFSDEKLGVVTIGFYNNWRWNKTKKKYTHRNKEVYCCSLQRTHLIEFYGTQKIFADITIGLNAIVKGYYILNYGLGYFEQKMYTNAGGIDLDSRNDISKEAYKHMKKQFPKLKWFTNKHGLFDVDCTAYNNKSTIR